MLKSVSPVLPQLANHHSLQLPLWHEVRALPDSVKYPLDLGPHHTAVLNAEDLAELQSCSSHSAQRGHHPLSVGLIQHQTGGPLADSHRTSGSLRDDSDAETDSQRCEARNPRDSGRGNSSFSG